MSRIFPLLIRYYSFKSDKPDDLEANDLVSVASTPNCETYTIRLQPQRDLETIGVGASAEVYGVDDEVVLRSSWILNDLGVVPLTAINGTTLQTRSFTPIYYRTNKLYYECFKDGHTLSL